MASVSMDFFESDLNPCSVESIPEPVELPDGSRIWPVMLGCYELQDSGKRHGRLDLYAVKVPDLRKSLHLQESMVLRFGTPAPALSAKESQKSGILDGKWIKASPDHHHHNELHQSSAFYFASAHSSGDISIHSCAVKSQEDDVPPSTEASIDSIHPMEIQLVGKSAVIDSQEKERPPLCLSLNWDSAFYDESSRIVSTYSDGRVAIYDVLPKQSTFTTSSARQQFELVERDSWEAHTMFTSPAEVWSAGFVGGKKSQTVLSGGDDGSLKCWDIRCTNRPTQVLKHFEAGVTVVAPHPRQDHLVACGSYDETICLYDVRYLSPSSPLGRRSGPLGGGIWRIKWHPYDDCRILVAAMHGGCRIVQIDTLDDTPVMLATKEFTEHKSMAYGADWLVCQHPTEEGYFEAAASCSFYDKAVYLWDTVA